MSKTWCLMPGFHHSVTVAVSPFPLRKFRKNYVSAVRITLLTWKFRCSSSSSSRFFNRMWQTHKTT